MKIKASFLKHPGRNSNHKRDSIILLYLLVVEPKKADPTALENMENKTVVGKKNQFEQK